MLTQEGKVYATYDFGLHWKSLKAQFEMFHSRMKMNVMSLLQNKNDNEMIILVSKDGENLVTYNCGATLQKLNKGAQLKEITFHPSDQNIMAAIDNKRNLMLSKNKGESWVSILEGVEEFTFARYSDEAYMAKKERIFALRNVKDKRDNKTIRELIYSDDYFNRWEVALKHVEFFKLTDCCVYVKSTNEKLKVADAFGNFYYFFDLEIEQANHEKFNSFNVVENGVTFQTFGTMVHQYSTFTTNFLMKANWFGTDFKILFDFLVCNQFMSMCDILPIESLAGVMLANRYEEKFVTFREDIPKNRRSNFDTISRLHNIDDYKMTQISFDFGENWTRVIGPTIDDKKKAFKCTSNCHLNLHLHSSFRDFNMPVSSEHMPGLVIASGNVGAYLIADKNDSEIGLFLSENGGLNWRMIKRGNFIYELLDNGSLIVVASRNYRSKYLEFSFDSGITWHKLIFSDRFQKVLSLTSKKTHNLQKLIIDVENPEGYKNKARIIALDFSNLHERHCKHNKEDPEASDYEEFKPHTADSENCFLGQEMSILRKKAERECFNNEKFALEDIKRYCPCKSSDFHCDFGFKSENGKCIFNQEIFGSRMSRKKNIHSAYMYLDNYLNPPKHCLNVYFATTGYRKNFGNFCVGGQSPETLQKRKCPGTFIRSISGFVFKMSLIVLFLFMVYHFNFHFFLIDLFITLQNKIRDFKKKRIEKKKKSYKELNTDDSEEQQINLKDGEYNQDDDEEDEDENKAETSRKINSIFDEDDEEEEENAIPF